MSGLSQCGNQMSTQYCLIKLVQTILASLLAMFALSQIILSSIKIHGRLLINFAIAIQLFLFFSLLCNIFHQIWAKTLAFENLGTWFNSMAFITIFYYVAWNCIRNRILRIVAHAIYIGFVIGFLGLLVWTFLEGYQKEEQSCTEVGYIILDGMLVAIAICLLGVFWWKHSKEQKLKNFYESRLITTQKVGQESSLSAGPFKKMWILIIANIACALINFSETILIIILNDGQCRFSQNHTEQATINFCFMFFDYYLGIFVTLLIFRKFRVSFQQALQANDTTFHRTESYSYDQNEGNRLQMMSQSSSSSR